MQYEGTIVHNPSIEGKQLPKLSRFLGKLIDVCVMGLAALMPIWFLPFTLDILELNKQTLLVIVTLVALIAWTGKSLLDRSFHLARSWLHIAVVAFLAGYVVTSLFSVDRYISFVGNIGQMQWSFVTIAAFVLLYLVIVNRFRSTGRVYDAILWFLLGSAVTGVYGLLQAFGVYIFGGVTASVSFNTIGTANALGTFLAIPTVIAAALTVLGCNDKTCYLGKGGHLTIFWRIVVITMLAVGLLSAIAIDFWIVWVQLLFGMVFLFLICQFAARASCKPKMLVVPAVIAVLSVLLLIVNIPLHPNLPAEVSPSAMHTWQIARQALTDAPLFGSGPGTWIYDYAKYRSIGVNVSQFWTIRFERGLSAFLTMLAMLGIAGTTLWLLLVGSGIVKSIRHLVKERSADAWLAYFLVFLGWSTTVLLAFLYNYNTAHHFVFWFLLALLGVLVNQGAFTWDQQSRKWVSAFLSILLIVLAVGAVSGAWLMGQRLVADARYSSAVASFRKGEDIEKVISHLQAAVNMNKWNDVYERNLSQAYLVRVGNIVQAEPTDELVNEVNANIQLAVEAAQKAADINPTNVDNYSNLAIVYQSIASFTRGADEFAIRNYEEALKYEPNNPVFMNEIGKLYVLRSDAYRTLLNAGEAEARQQAQANVNAELEKAETWFNKAISAKPDYAAAKFNLGLVYERQGRLSDSVRKFEEVLATNPTDIGIAFQLAVLYYRDGNREASRNLFEQIVQAQPSYANARWFLSSIYEEEGRYDEAIAQVEEVYKTNVDNAQVLRRLADLKAKRDAGAAPAEASELPSPVEEVISGPEDQNLIQP